MKPEVARVLLDETRRKLGCKEFDIFYQTAVRFQKDFPSSLASRWSQYWNNHHVLVKEVQQFCKETLNEPDS